MAPTFDSLRLRPRVGREPILFKESQAGMPAGGLPPDMGQSPVTGSPDEMQAPESANQRQFEDDFGSLAYQFVQDRAPALIPYMLGFEVVDRNDDGSKAVGIFGYKIDEDFYYIPVFFLNNQVRGVDMILNKRTNQFVPLTEKWVDYIVNRHSIRIGTPASGEVRDTMRNPDLSFVRRPQAAMGYIGKAAEDSAPWTPSEAWRRIREKTAEMAQDPLFREMFAGISGGMGKCAESEYIKGFMERHGGPECMSSLLASMHDVDFANAALTLYKGAEAFWTDRLAGASIHVDRMRKAAEAMPKVRVLGSVGEMAKSAQDAPKADVGSPDAPLSDEENARHIVERDFTIDDRRPDSEVAQVTDDRALVDFEKRFQPPDGPGRYGFVMSDGLVRDGTLLDVAFSPACKDGDAVAVFEEDGGFILGAASPRAMVATVDAPEDAGNDPLEDLFGKASPMPDIEIGSGDPKAYLFIDGKGHAAGPFFIRSSIVDGDHIRFVTGYGDGQESFVHTKAPEGLAPSYGFMDWDLSDRWHDRDGRAREEGLCRSNPCCDSPVNLISIGSFSGLPRKIGAGLVIPHDWKALPVRTFRSYAKHYGGESDADRRMKDQKVDEEYANLKSRYTFGTPSDILEAMRSEGVERIKVASDGVEFTVAVDGASRRHGPMGYKAAAVDLVTRFGFRPRRAFSALSKAASGEEATFLVKVPSLVKGAQDSLVNVAMPAPMEQLPSIDPYSGVPVYVSPYVDMVQGQTTGVPGLPPEGGLTRGINIGGEMERGMGGGEYPDEHSDSMPKGALPIDEEARRLAEEAAKAGQRHVFDQAAIGGLAKVYDTSNVVDSYIPDFMDTIDRLGRILFLFYWKHEDFNQRYGSDDVVQMEDRLRNVFKQLGELALNLKEKSVQKE